MTEKESRKKEHFKYLHNFIENFVSWIQNNVILTIIGFTLLVGIPTIYFYIEIIPKAPKPMAGEWNLAVARFTSKGSESINSTESILIANIFFNRLSAELTDLSEKANLIIEVRGPAEIESISGNTPEERAIHVKNLARKINADMIVYGSVTNNEGMLQLKPEFFLNISNYFETEEIVGHHSFGKNINIIGKPENLPSQLNLNRELSRRAQSLALIGKGLSLYLTHAYEDALGFFNTANNDNFWLSVEGREVLYLFLGNAAGKANLLEKAEEYYLSSLNISPEYARGYIGLGGIYYLMSLQNNKTHFFIPNIELLDQSVHFFKRSLNSKIQPITTDISAKVAFGIGQAYLAKWYIGFSSLSQAVEQFQEVINKQGDKQQLINEVVAEAYARLGLIEGQLNNYDNALSNYQRAIASSLSPKRRALYWASLSDLHSKKGQDGLARDSNNKAIQDLLNAIQLTTGSEQITELWISISKRYELIKEYSNALEAAEKALVSAKKDEDKSLSAKAFGQLANIETRLGNIQNGISFCRNAIESTENISYKALFWSNLANMYYINGEEENYNNAIETAIASYFESLEHNSNSIEQAFTYEKISSLFEILGQINKAQKYRDIAIDLLPEKSHLRKSFIEK